MCGKTSSFYGKSQYPRWKDYCCRPYRTWHTWIRRTQEVWKASFTSLPSDPHRCSVEVAKWGNICNNPNINKIHQMEGNHRGGFTGELPRMSRYTMNGWRRAILCTSWSYFLGIKILGKVTDQLWVCYRRILFFFSLKDELTDKVDTTSKDKQQVAETMTSSAKLETKG